MTRARVEWHSGIANAMYSYVVVTLFQDENLVPRLMTPLGDRPYFPSHPDIGFSQAAAEKPLIWRLVDGRVKVPMRVRYRRMV